MDDGYREFRRNKPQQKFYKPGSGPLRRSGNGIDGRSEQYCSQVSLNDESLTENCKEPAINRLKKPEQQLYIPKTGDSNSDVDKQSKKFIRSDNTSQYNNKKMSNRQEMSGYSGSGTYSRGATRRDRSYGDQKVKNGANNDINYNRNYRQPSETRSISPTHSLREKGVVDRHRDSRSMEISAGRQASGGGGGKPPSGRRNSAGYSSDNSRHKFMVNLENLPPRLRKKFLEQSGHHSFDSVDQLYNDRSSANNYAQPNYNQSQMNSSSLNWSQTLPSRGRGRLRDNESFDREKFLNSYLKNYEVQNSGTSTPSSSYMNLHEPNAEDHKNEKTESMSTSVESQNDYYNTSKNGVSSQQSSISCNHNESNDRKQETHESEISQITTSLLDMTNLDWTEEVEKNIKLDDACDTSTSFSQNLKSAVSQENKPAESQETKRSGRSRRKNRRSSSRGQKNGDKKPESNRKGSNASIQHEPSQHERNQHERSQHERSQHERSQHERSHHERNQHEKSQHERNQHERNQHERSQHERSQHERSQHERSQHERSQHERSQHERSQHERSQHERSQHERNRRDSNASIQQEAIFSNLRQKDRERRDSHRSNRSSTIGNSRDDLDRWRSLRSYSREQSTEGRIVSQCNSRDTSANRAISPKDGDKFRVPFAVPKAAPNKQKRSNGPSWPGGRPPSTEPGRQSPAPSAVSTDVGSGDGGGSGLNTAVATGGAGSAGGASEGGGRRSRKRAGVGRRRARHADPAPPAHAPPPVFTGSSTMNWREEILESKKHNSHDTPSEHTNHRVRRNSTMSDKSGPESSTSHPGLLVLPQSAISDLQKDQGRGGSMETQKTLYDHQNPSKPIIVQSSPSKIDIRMERGVRESASSRSAAGGGGGGGGPEAGEVARAARHRALLQEVDRADAVLQAHVMRGPLALASRWPDVGDTRNFLQSALQRLLMSDLKYCQADNIEHNFWKILYYNFIEMLRKSFQQISPEDKPKIVKLINTIIEEGNAFFENLIQMLEKTYKFNTDDYINDNHILPPKGLGYVGLALISVQKLYVFLGDLARYKEQVNETNNFAKSKFWYTKAQQINPKNGRPYNQLAILAIYARRKLDAVYYYMRSLMSSNPFHSARESLLSLFDENRKKYETAERKRRATQEGIRNGEHGEGSNSGPQSSNQTQGKQGQGFRSEVWVRPSGRRTTTLQHDKRDEHFTTMTSVELNKSFITSYLHVHGKLITKIGMETFHECASAMLRQFRALLHRQPLPTPAARLLQLTALNMFAVETTTASMRDAGNSGERTAWLDCALGVSLLMFGALLERCCDLLPEPALTQQHTDALLLLPAIKVWSDWMLCHSSIWNPPPSFDNFEMETDNDPWDWLAKLMNILEALDDKSIKLENEPKDGFVAVRLAEDATLGGFTPLMYMEAAVAWLRPEPAVSHHVAEHALRTRKLLFFGTEYLVGVEPPVLRLEFPAGAPPRYVSAVQRAQPLHQPLQHLSEDSEDEDTANGAASGPASLGEGLEGPEGTDETTRKLLKRKEQLESRKATLDRRHQRMQEILRGGWVSVEVEVRPRWLVPDTNCFIDHLALLQAVAASDQPYTLAVPLVVMTELEGLKKCSRVGPNASNALAWMGSASGASNVRLATTRGSLLASRTFTAERDQPRASNDDRVLATALSLHENFTAESEARKDKDDSDPSKCVRRIREVVLLTDDRNLRVKALAAEMPARDLPSFVQWAGISLQETKNDTQASTSDDKSGHN